MAGRSLREDELADQIVARIEQENLPPGSRLPPERLLSEQLACSRYLLRAALRKLEARGILDRRPQSGYYVLRLPSQQTQILPPNGVRLVSLMLMDAGQQRVLGELQREAMNERVMLHTYFASEHGASPEEEREYLLHAAESGAAAVIVHATPVEPVNDDLFRELDRRLCLIHVGWHGLGLPEQSFFVPDYRLAGGWAAARLLEHGCRTLYFASGLASSHHVTRLIAAGMAGVLGAPPIEMTSMWPGGDLLPQAREMLQQATRQTGFVVFGRSGLVIDEVLTARGLAPEARPRLVLIADEPEDPAPAAAEVLGFSWAERVRDAVNFVLRGAGNSHRSYPPQWLRRG